MVNWYDGEFEHRIAAHWDSPAGLVPDSRIVTISLGAIRTFQLIRKRLRLAVEVRSGSVLILPSATNARFVHRAPHLDEDSGRRISLTFRAFVDPPVE